MERKRYINCVILEDEFYTAHEICRLLKDYDERYRVTHIFERCEDFMRFLSTGEMPDLIVSNILLADGYVSRIPNLSELNVPLILTCIGNRSTCPIVRNLIGIVEKPVTKELLFENLEIFESIYSPQITI